MSRSMEKPDNLVVRQDQLWRVRNTELSSQLPRASSLKSCQDCCQLQRSLTTTDDRLVLVLLRHVSS